MVINLATALLLMRDREHDLNRRGAFLHMMADAAVTVGVVVAGLGMLWTGWLWLDPAISLMIAAVIFIGTWGLLKESFKLALPAGANCDASGRVWRGVSGRTRKTRMDARPGASASPIPEPGASFCPIPRLLCKFLTPETPP